MNKNKISFFDLQLFTETETIVDIALQTGELKADVENLEESHEEINNKVEQVERNQQWNDESISRLFDRVNALENKIEEAKDEIIEEVEEVEEKEEEEEETKIEQEQTPPAEGNTNTTIITMIGTLVFGGIIVFLIKLFENKKGGEVEI